MDPNAMLEILDQALRDWDSAHDRYDKEGKANAHQLHTSAQRDLAAWLDRGGFQPNWFAYPKAAGWFLTWWAKR